MTVQIDAHAKEISLRVAKRYAKIMPRYRDVFEVVALEGVFDASRNLPDGTTEERWKQLCADASRWRIRKMLFEERKHEAVVTMTTEALDEMFEHDRMFAAIDSADAIEGLLGLLGGRQRELCRLVYSEGLNVRAACRQLGIPYSTGDKIHTNALARLRARLAAA